MEMLEDLRRAILSVIAGIVAQKFLALGALASSSGCVVLKLPKI